MEKNTDTETIAKRVREATIKEIFETFDNHYTVYNSEKKTINYKQYIRIKQKFIK